MRNTYRRVGRPPKSGPDALANPFHGMTPEERRTLFLDTAARLFEERGYANTSIEDITQALGLSKGIFYYYWSNKRELINEIHARVMVLHNERLDHILATITSPELRLEEAIRSHLDVVLDNKSLIATLMKEVHYPDEIIEDRRSYTDRLQELFDEGISAGVVRNADSRILTFAMLGLCRSVVQWYQPGGRLSRDEIKETFVRFAVEGYANGWRESVLPARDSGRRARSA
jgi:TetR/AcrR family transcriptional regulator, cholesterol catabolism regulator